MDWETYEQLTSLRKDLDQNKILIYCRMESADIYYDIDTERQKAGLQSMINGWTIEIQMLQLKIDEVQKELDNIKNTSTR